MIRTQNLAPKLVIQYMGIPHRSKCTTEWGYNQPYMSIEWECKKKKKKGMQETKETLSNSGQPYRYEKRRQDKLV